VHTKISTTLRARFYWNMKSVEFLGLTPTKSLHPVSLTPLNTTVMPTTRVFRATQLFSSKFYPFLPADVSPKTSFARGPGLDYENAGSAGTPSNFTVFSVDAYGNPRLNGGDMWTATLSQHCKHFPSTATLYAEFSNLQNGTYYVEYTPTVSGRYWLSVASANSDGLDSPALPVARIMSSPLNIKQSPFSILILSGQVDVASCRILGNIYNSVSGFTSFFLLMVQDVFGNYASGRDTVTMDARLNSVQYDDSNIAGRAQSPSRPSTGNVSFAGTEATRGSYLCDWTPLSTGIYQVSILIRVTNHPSTPGKLPFAALLQPITRVSFTHDPRLDATRDRLPVRPAVLQRSIVRPPCAHDTF
jgi:hypothetical protein